MPSVPYSRYLIYPVTWYSFLIVIGASLALFFSCREEKYARLPRDTVLDLADTIAQSLRRHYRRTCLLCGFFFSSVSE